MKPRHWVYVLILVVGLVNVISYTNLNHRPDLQAVGDATFYIKMSEQTFAHVPSPYAFRLLSPLIVHELQKLPGLGLNSSWLLLTFTATSLALIVFFKLLHDQLKLSLFISTIFTIMLGCTYNYALFNYYDMWLVDPLNNLFYVLALYFLLSRRIAAFIAVIVVGSVNKETTMLLAPLYPLLAYVRSGKLISRDVITSTAAVAGVFMLYLVYRHWMLIMLGPGSHAFLSSLNQGGVLETIRTALSPSKFHEQAEIYGVFQFLWFIFVYALYQLYKSYRWKIEWLALSVYIVGAVIVGRLFATDVGRVFVMIAPVVLGVSAIAFEGFKSEQQRLWLMLLASIYLALNFQWLQGGEVWLANAAALVIFIAMLQPSELDFKKLFQIYAHRNSS